MYSKLNARFRHYPDMMWLQKWCIAQIATPVPRVDAEREVRNHKNNGGEPELLKDWKRILVCIQVSIVEGDDDGLFPRGAVLRCAAEDIAYGRCAKPMMGEIFHLFAKSALRDNVTRRYRLAVRAHTMIHQNLNVLPSR